MTDFIEPAVSFAASAFPSLFDFGASVAPAALEGGAAALESAPSWFPATAETLASAAPTALTVGGDIAASAGPGLFASLGEGIGSAFAGGLPFFGGGMSNFFSTPAAAATPSSPGAATPNDTVAQSFADLGPGATDPSTGWPTTGDPGAATPTPSEPLTKPIGMGQAGGGSSPADVAASGESLDDLTTLKGANQPPQALGAQPADTASPTKGTATSPAKPGFLDSMVSGAKDQVTKNPLGLALGAGGLGYNIFQSKQNAVPAAAPAANANNAIAQQNQATGAAVTAEGQQLASYISSGTLPPAFQTAVDNATKAAKAKAISNAAAQGQPTDPAKNTTLAQSLEAIDRQATAQAAGIMQQLATTGTQLINSGTSMAGLSSKIYDALVAQDNAQSANVGKAIANFAAAMNPAGSKIAA